MNYFVLNAELVGDPLVRGYAGMTDQEAADDLNTVYRTRNRTQMSGDEILQSVDDGEYTLLPDIKKNAFWGLLGIGNVDPFGKAADIVQEIFGASNTLTALQAARVETISRAEELGLGALLASDVGKARAL